MITLEAFITKANIKQVVKNNSVKPIKYDDIKFRDPENSDMNKFSKRLQSKFSLSGKYDGLNIVTYNIGQTGFGYRDYIALFIQHRVNNSPDIGGSHLKMECLLLFKIDWDKEDDEYDVIFFCQPGTEKKEMRDKDKYKELYEICGEIAGAMGFTEWDDYLNGWTNRTN